MRYPLDVLDVAPDRIAAATTLLDMIDSGRLTANGADVGVDRAGLHRRRRGRSVFHYFVRWLRLRRHDTGTGIWLGNCLGEQELNRRGLHALPPGERLASNMAPTVGRGPNGEVLAIGSLGADRITGALQQVITAFVDGGMSLAEAIAKPAFTSDARLDVMASRSSSTSVTWTFPR